MTLAEALDIVVARTKHERFRQLCDPNDPAYSPGYIAVVMSMATGEPMPPPVYVAMDGTAVELPPPRGRPLPLRSALAAVNTCLYRSCPRGCQKAWCWAFKRDVTIYECVDCLS